MRVKKQQLELNVEQLTDSKLGKVYKNAVYCHPAYLTDMQNTSLEMPDWKNYKLEHSYRGGNTIPPYLSSEKPVCRPRNNSSNWIRNKD